MICNFHISAFVFLKFVKKKQCLNVLNLYSFRKKCSDHDKGNAMLLTQYTILSYLDLLCIVIFSS